MDRIDILGVRAEVARSFFERLRGLIGRRSLGYGEGMLILHCNAIHTFFMRFAIDAVFLDRNDRVVREVRGIPPWRPFVWGGWRAVKVLETASGSDFCSCVSARNSVHYSHREEKAKV